MNPTQLKMKSFVIDLTANCSVWFGAITTWQVDFDYWIRVTAGMAAVAVSFVTIYFKIKNNGKDK